MSEIDLLLTPESQLLIVQVIAPVVVAMMAAYVVWSLFGPLLRSLRVFLQPRQPGEEWPEFFQRARAEFLHKQADQQALEQAERERVSTRYGSRRKTMMFDLLNPVLLFGALYLIAYGPGSLWWIVGYWAAGFMVNVRLNIVRFEDLPSLDRSERHVLWLFYAWFWPLCVWAWRDARQQQG